MRAEKIVKGKGKSLAREQAEKEVQARAKKKEADAMKLKAIKLRREELKFGVKSIESLPGRY